MRGQDRGRLLADVESERVAFGVEIGLGVEVADRADEGRPPTRATDRAAIQGNRRL